MWTKITENTTSNTWHLATVLTIPEDPVFDTPGDEMPCSDNVCRLKTIHAQGSHAKIEWKDLGGHPYTGMFRGADSGYVRMSVANPENTVLPLIAPGMGVKLLRDGADSANFVAMFSLDGQATLNFFANDFSNHVPASTGSSLDAL